jgi:hypothetical protein
MIPLQYNISGFVNESDTLANIVTQINNASNGFFVLGMLFLIFVIAFIALKAYETKVALFVSSMLTTFLTIISWGLEWVGFFYITVPAILLLISLIWMALGE